MDVFAGTSHQSRRRWMLAHPWIATVSSVELVCQPDMVAYYRRWGFTDKVGQSRLMRRTADPSLISDT